MCAIYCNSLTTDLQDYHFHRCCYTCANIDFKATTVKQHKGEQFHKSLNGSSKNGVVDVSLQVWKVGWATFPKNELCM